MPLPLLRRRTEVSRWTPKRISGLQVWLRSDLGLYQDTARTTPATALSDPVGGWADQSGNGNHVSQATAGNRPVLNPSAIGGRPSLVTPTIGTQTYFTLPASLAVDRRAHSWVFIGRTRSLLNASSRCAVSFNSGLTDLMTEFTGTTGTQPRLRTFGTTAQTAAIWGRSSLSVITLTASASAVTIRVNGEQVALSAYTAGTMTGGTLAKRSDAQPWAGELYEFGVYNRALTSTETTQLEAYAVTRYGRALSPVNEIVISGDSLTEGQQATNQQGWPWKLDDSLGATWQQLSMGRQTAYLGASGSTLLSEASDLAATYRGGKTKHVAIQAGGTNDLGTAAASAATVLGYAQSWANTMKTAGWYVVFCTIATRSDAGWSPAKETERQAYNAGLSGLTNVDAVADIASLPELSNPNSATYFDTDHLHWLQPAFVAVEAAIRPVVQAA